MLLLATAFSVTFSIGPATDESSITLQRNKTMKKNDPDRPATGNPSVEEQRRRQLAEDLGYVLAWHWQQRCAAGKRLPLQKAPIAYERPKRRRRRLE